MIRLFTTSYKEPDDRRTAEYLQCLKNNLQNSLIDEICVLDEDSGVLPVHQKVRTRSVSRRPTYHEFFQWINQLAAPSDISIIANSDIYFDQTLKLLRSTLQRNTCAALSRWDILADGSCRLFDRNDSQDVWVFRGPVGSVICNFPLGVPRCDNRILHELRMAGYQVINPAFTIRTLHLHGGVRTEYVADPGGCFVPGPYAYLFPHNLLPLPQFLHCWLLGRTGGAGYHVDWRLLRRWRPDRVLRRFIGRMLK